MEVPTPPGVLAVVAYLRQKLWRELEGLVGKRSGLLREVEALDKEIETKRRMMELVEATEEQLVDQERGQQAIEGG
jgi:hypothetical protein